MEEYDKQADDLEREAEKLEHEGERVGEDIEETRKDWEAKKDASDVPGATPDDEDGEGE